MESIIGVLDPYGDEHDRKTLAGLWYAARHYQGEVPNSSNTMSQVVRQMDSVLGTLLKGHMQKTKGWDGPIVSGCVFHTRQLQLQDNLVFVLMPFKEMRLSA